MSNPTDKDNKLENRLRQLHPKAMSPELMERLSSISQSQQPLDERASVENRDLLKGLRLFLSPRKLLYGALSVILITGIFLIDLSDTSTPSQSDQAMNDAKDNMESEDHLTIPLDAGHELVAFSNPAIAQESEITFETTTIIPSMTADRHPIEARQAIVWTTFEAHDPDTNERVEISFPTSQIAFRRAPVF